MLDMFSMSVLQFADGGLGSLQQDIVDNWLGPLFLIIVAALSIKFLINKQFRALATFLVIAAIVGVLIFAGQAFFGKGGSITEFAKDKSGKVFGGGGGK